MPHTAAAVKDVDVDSPVAMLAEGNKLIATLTDDTGGMQVGKRGVDFYELNQGTNRICQLLARFECIKVDEEIGSEKFN